MNLTTTFLGLKLNSPLIVGASPLADDVAMARELQEAGAGAIVMRSLFEEQIYLDQISREPGVEGAADAADPEYFPAVSGYHFSPDQYLRHLAALKAALKIPVIASLNGCRPGGWTDYARRFEAEGADAIELNLYQISTDPARSGGAIEAEMLEAVCQVKSSIRIPLAVKLQPFYTSLPFFARELERAGADGLVLFNRFYQAEFAADAEHLEPQLRLSDSSELLLRLRWAAILSPETRCSLALTGGFHRGADVVKAILAGAHAVQIVSAVLKGGPLGLDAIRDGLTQWMRNRGYSTPGEFRGAMNLESCPDAGSFERGSYQRLLQNWRP